MTRRRRPLPVDEQADGPQRPEVVCRDCREAVQYCVCEWPEDVRWSVR